MNNIIIGIDPGFSGAIAFLNIVTNQLRIRDLPLKKIMGKTQIDVKAFNLILRPFLPYLKWATIEDVHAMPKQGVVSTFRFGYNAGILLGVLQTHNLKVLRVKPSVWKSALGLTRNKNDSLLLAKKSFSPQYAHYFTRKKDDGRAEAALIALYASSCF